MPSPQQQPIELVSAREIVHTLGGHHAVARLIGGAWKTAYHWTLIDQFPSDTYVIMSVALLRRGYWAQPYLWNMAGFPRPTTEIPRA